MSRLHQCLTSLSLLILLLGGNAAAQTNAAPSIIPFQGLVTTSEGHLVPDGSYAVIFNIYADAVGGQPLWTERHTKVGVINGQLNVFLGSIPRNSVALSSLDYATVKYLGITIDIDGVPTTPDPEMVPRQLLTPAFYALRAANADKLAGFDWSALFSSGNPQTGTIAGTRITGGTVTTDQLQAGLVRSQLATGGVDSLMTSVPVSATLASAGYARELSTLNVGSSTFFVYRHTASPVDRFTLATAATTGTEYTDGQTAPVDLGVVSGAGNSIVLHVRNLGTRALTGLTATIDGTNTAEFSYVFGSTSVPIASSTTLTITGTRGAVFSAIRNAVIHVSATGITNAFDLNLTKTTPVPSGYSLIPAGAFTMGRTSGDTDTNAPPVTINVSAFIMQQTETTKAGWDAVLAWAVTNGYTDLAVGYGDAQDLPVLAVSWIDAVKWCNARSQMEGLTPCYTVAGAVMKTGGGEPTVNWATNGYRLPTEAEWEKAARGGVSGKRFPWGTDTIKNGLAASGGQANYYFNPNVPYDIGSFVYPYPQGFAPVASYGANGFGLYDMAGNVFEWCWDWYGANSYVAGVSDPRGPATGSYRVMRGGSASEIAVRARCCDRFMLRSAGTLGDPELGEEYGFRPVRGRP